MQLRDDIPTILYPGVWGLFGGHLEPGETPEDGLRREIQEEIHYQIVSPAKFRCYADREAVRYIYYAPLTVPMKQLVLQEGWDYALVPPDAIRQGQCYSAKANQVRLLGSLHQTILLDFLEAQLESKRESF